MSVVTKETLQHSSWTVITNTGRPLLNIEMNVPIWRTQLNLVGLNRVAFIEA